MLAPFMPQGSPADNLVAGIGFSADPMQGAELVAIRIAQIGQVQVTHSGVADAGRVFDGLATGFDARLVPGVHLFGAAHGKPNRSAIRACGGFTVQGLRDDQTTAGMGIDKPTLCIGFGGCTADDAKRCIIECFGTSNVVATQHDVAEHEKTFFGQGGR